MTSVITLSADCASMAPRFFGAALISTQIALGRGYLLVRGALPDGMAFFDIDDSVLMESKTFGSIAEAQAWIDGDIAARRRPS